MISKTRITVTGKNYKDEILFETIHLTLTVGILCSQRTASKFLCSGDLLVDD